MSKFVHLHVHSDYSLLDGLGKIDDYLSRVQDQGMDSLALTDHGVLYGALDFYQAARKRGIRPIIGCEAYLAPDGIQTRGHNHHVTVLAKNRAGYANLMWLASMASLKGYYRKPRLDLAMLKERREGLIVLSGCPNGVIPMALRGGDQEAARQAAQVMLDLFGDDFYIEIMRHGIAVQEEFTPQLIDLARDLRIPLVATNDVHYATAADAHAHDVLLCVQTGSTVDDPKRLRMDANLFYLRGPEEMAELFADLPEAVENTVRIAEQVDIKLEFGQFYLPAFPVPEDTTPERFLEAECRSGLAERYPEVTPEIEERLQYELGVINQMGFATYFLVVADFVQFARREGILVGPGRGSAAGSIVAYLLSITNIDPLRHHLIFERFLNPERISMPDIDMDFADDRRDEVIRYVQRKYGAERVAQIITFGTMAARAAIRDVGRTLGMPYGEVDRVAKLIPFQSSISEALENVPELSAIYHAEEPVRTLLDTSRRLEGVTRHASTHAAGVVISRDPLVEHVPVQRAPSKAEGSEQADTVTQYHMKNLEAIGLLKMDFLGLTTLSILGRAARILKQNRDIDLDLDDLPLEDPAIYRVLQSGDTMGIFQLEGGSTTRMTIDVRPGCFDDVTALMALIRPGPAVMAPDYIQRKHGQVPIAYMHPEMEPILRETYGVTLYQEQVMRIANVLAGYSMAEADGLRKAMGKKLPEEMAKHRDRFVSGCRQHGLDQTNAEEIFEMIERFAGYGFNKAHSAAYAVICCQTAYLKGKYPVEYMTAVLSTEIGNTDKIVAAIADCRRMGLEVRPPDVNRSQLEFSVERVEDGVGKWRDAIRFGLGAVKNAGESAIEMIVAAREALPAKEFRSLDQLCREVDLQRVNRSALESLIKCGAMDCLGRRSQLLAVLDRAINLGKEMRRAREAGQMGLFGEAGEEPAEASIVLPEVEDLPRKVTLAWEKEVLGLYVGEHPLHHALRGVDDSQLTPLGEIGQDLSGKNVVVAGMLGPMRRLVTKTKKTMLVVQVEDLTGTMEMVAFPECYERHLELWQEDNIVRIKARVDTRNDSAQLICDTMAPLQSGSVGTAPAPAPSNGANGHAPRALKSNGNGNGKTAAGGIATAPAVPAPRDDPRRRFHLHIRLPSTADYDDDVRRMQELDRLMRRFRGRDRATLYLPSADSFVCLEPYDQQVEYCSEFETELLELLGQNALIRVEDYNPAEEAAG